MDEIESSLNRVVRIGEESDRMDKQPKEYESRSGKLQGLIKELEDKGEPVIIEQGKEVDRMDYNSNGNGSNKHGNRHPRIEQIYINWHELGPIITRAKEAGIIDDQFKVWIVPHEELEEIIKKIEIAYLGGSIDLTDYERGTLSTICLVIANQKEFSDVGRWEQEMCNSETIVEQDEKLGTMLIDDHAPRSLQIKSYNRLVDIYKAKQPVEYTIGLYYYAYSGTPGAPIDYLWNQVTWYETVLYDFSLTLYENIERLTEYKKRCFLYTPNDILIEEREEYFNGDSE